MTIFDIGRKCEWEYVIGSDRSEAIRNTQEPPCLILPRKPSFCSHFSLQYLWRISVDGHNCPESSRHGIIRIKENMYASRVAR
ncbi:MAG: hypothetical protein GY820_05535 [Gammaproteobacteria bacterium]|nr:hypothetical protein [Gammaproteobacteria bacterium]